MAASKNGVVTATLDYEQWLRRQVDVVEADLELKHRQMAGSLFAFLRGTFYRWEPLFKEVCGDLVEAPRVLAVGDLHVENFGTWRDKEGRLIWGVNDFDEVAEMPYAVDLVRLVTSAILAERENKLSINAADAATAVLQGYTEFLQAGGKPFVLEESHPNLREMALSAERDPVKFWSKLSSALPVTPPKRVRRLLGSSLPEGTGGIAYSHRIAGEGSLGRPRYVATGSCHGGLVAREAKAWLPSAWGWAKGKPKHRAYAVRLLKRSVRQPDPYYIVEDGYVVRRIGPHCGRIRARGLSQAARRTADPERHGARDRQFASSDASPADQAAARPRRKKFGLAYQSGARNGKRHQAGLGGLSLLLFLLNRLNLLQFFVTNER